MDDDRWVNTMPNGAIYLQDGERIGNIAPGVDIAERDAKIAAFFAGQAVADAPIVPTWLRRLWPFGL